MALQILIIDDDEADYESAKRTILEEAATINIKPQIYHATTLNQGLERMSSDNFDAVLLDMNLPDSVELSGLDRILKNHPSIPVVILTGLESEGLALNAIHTGAQDYIVKGDRGLFRAIRYAVERSVITKSLIAAEEKAREASNSKSNFLAQMNHEIRTPLASILGWTDILLKEPLGHEQQNNALHLISKNGKHLMSLINDILDISKIEAGKFDLEILSVGLFEIVSEVLGLLQELASEKGLDFKVEYVFPLPLKISTDPLRHKQVLINLISNAIKFTSAGSVTLSVSCDLITNFMIFKVSDTGVGISSDSLTKIFSVFTQADLSTTRKYGGSGLGLAITKNIVDQMKGTIEIESELGQGSTFTVKLPQENLSNQVLVSKIPEPATKIEVQPLQLTGRILVAEDNEDNRELIQFILTKVGLQAEFCVNGLEATHLAMAISFDIVIMDMNMPVMDGLDATRFLRKKGFQQKIIALTANNTRGHLELCIDAGCDDFLSKPFSKAELLNIIDKHSNEIQFNQRKVEQVKPKKVLNSIDAILADDPTCLPLALRFLENLPIRYKQLEEAYQSKKFEELSRFAHSLKGASGNYRLTEIERCAEELEHQAISSDPSKCLEMIKAIGQAIKDTDSLAERLKNEFRDPDLSNTP